MRIPADYVYIYPADVWSTPPDQDQTWLMLTAVLVTLGAFLTTAAMTYAVGEAVVGWLLRLVCLGG